MGILQRRLIAIGGPAVREISTVEVVDERRYGQQGDVDPTALQHGKLSRFVRYLPVPNLTFTGTPLRLAPQRGSNPTGISRAAKAAVAQPPFLGEPGHTLR